MSYLLDTNVLSNAVAKTPDAGVEAWLRGQALELLHVSVITLGEMRYGVERLPASARRRRFAAHLRTLADALGSRVLSVDAEVAERWGVIRRRCEVAGRSMQPADALLAGTAEVHGLTLVTRNRRDFEVWGGPVFDPWTQTSPR